MNPIRMKLFHLSLREIHALLTRGKSLPSHISVASIDIPEGAKIHHIGVNTSGMAIDAYVEHESFPEINDDRYEMVVFNNHFCVSAYRVIKDDLILADLNEEQLVALREEIDNRLCPKPFDFDADTQKLMKDKIGEICERLGVPKRIFIGQNVSPPGVELETDIKSPNFGGARMQPNN